MFSHKERGIVQHRFNHIHLSELYEQQDEITVQYLLQNNSSLAHHSTKHNINDPEEN